MKQDYYEVLDVSKSASDTEIKKAYRKKAIEYHPDKNPGDKSMEEKFKLAAEAYDVLGNPEKRAKYDQFGHNAFSGGDGRGFSGHGMNMEDIFSHFGNIFGDAFGSNFGGGHSKGQPQLKGSNLRISIKLTLSEVVSGVEKKIKIKRKIQAEGVTYKNCSNCNGTGQVTRIANTMLGQMQTTSTCNKCYGGGQVVDRKPSNADSNGLKLENQSVLVKIPPGVEDGMQLKVSGKGNDAPGEGISGDLIVVIKEIENDTLKREGSNIHYDMYISVPEAILGSSKEIPTATGKAKIKIESGIQSGKILRLKGKGIPNIRGYGSGDMLIHVNVWTPKNLSKKDKDYFESVKGSSDFNPTPDKGDSSFFDKVKEMFS